MKQIYTPHKVGERDSFVMTSRGLRYLADATHRLFLNYAQSLFSTTHAYF